MAPNEPPGKIIFFIYLISSFALAGALEDTEMRFRKRRFALSWTGRH
jgi:hypothetical protein